MRIMVINLLYYNYYYSHYIVIKLYFLRNFEKAMDIDEKNVHTNILLRTFS